MSLPGTAALGLTITADLHIKCFHKSGGRNKTPSPIHLN